MKQSFHVFLIFLFYVFLLLSHSISPRSLPQKQGEEKEVKADGFPLPQTISSFKELEEEDLMKLMGSESGSCDDKEEECLKRRMMADAHLDYIYTQHKQP